MSDYDIRATDYSSEETITSAIETIDKKADDIVNAVSGKSTYEKLKYFNNILTTTNEYNTSSDLNTIDHDCHECTAALSGSAGIDGPVCESYAKAFKVLCDKADIPCILVEGTAGEAHMWNYVQIDGSWYAVDVTWNAPKVEGISGIVSGYEHEKYFLIGSNTIIDDEAFSSSHTITNKTYPNNICFTNLPTLSENSYDASSHQHTYTYEYDNEYHWQICNNKDCPVSDKGKTTTVAHNFDNDSDTTCNTCSYTRQKESTPIVNIDYTLEQLTFDTLDSSYKIYDTNGTLLAELNNGNPIVINSDWYNTTISIVKIARNNDYIHSDTVQLSIPARPTAPSGLSSTEESVLNAKDGKITGLDSTKNYEYRIFNSNDDWTSVSNVSEITGLTANDYEVRFAATDSAFTSDSILVTVKTHNHSYTENEYSFDTTGHWQICNDTNCPVSDKGKTTTVAHNFDNDSDTTCNTCSYTREKESTPIVSINYSS